MNSTGKSIYFQADSVCLIKSKSLPATYLAEEDGEKGTVLPVKINK